MANGNVIAPQTIELQELESVVRPNEDTRKQTQQRIADFSRAGASGDPLQLAQALVNNSTDLDPTYQSLLNSLLIGASGNQTAAFANLGNVIGNAIAGTN